MVMYYRCRKYTRFEMLPDIWHRLILQPRSRSSELTGQTLPVRHAELLSAFSTHDDDPGR